jgi:hypothetical protein
MSTESLETSHHTSLIIDLIHHKIYLADPNGKTTFFNKLYKIDISNKIDLLLQYYFTQFNIFGFDYEFVPSHIWNPQYICINKFFDNSIIGSGHYLHITQEYINNIYNLFFELSDDEILYIINSYMNGIYKILTNF